LPVLGLIDAYGCGLSFPKEGTTYPFAGGISPL